MGIGVGCRTRFGGQGPYKPPRQFPRFLATAPYNKQWTYVFVQKQSGGPIHIYFTKTPRNIFSKFLFSCRTGEKLDDVSEAEAYFAPYAKLREERGQKCFLDHTKQMRKEIEDKYIDFEMEGGK